MRDALHGAGRRPARQQDAMRSMLGGGRAADGGAALSSVGRAARHNPSLTGVLWGVVHEVGWKG